MTAFYFFQSIVFLICVTSFKKARFLNSTNKILKALMLLVLVLSYQLGFAQCGLFNFNASDGTSDAYVTMTWSIPETAYQLAAS